MCTEEQTDEGHSKKKSQAQEKMLPVGGLYYHATRTKKRENSISKREKKERKKSNVSGFKGRSFQPYDSTQSLRQMKMELRNPAPNLKQI